MNWAQKIVNELGTKNWFVLSRLESVSVRTWSAWLCHPFWKNSFSIEFKIE